MMDTMTHITLQDIGPFRQWSMELTPPSLPPGGVTVLVGPNGSGKTTVLRALALALVPAAIATTVLIELRQHVRQHVLREYSPEGRITVAFADGSVSCRITNAITHDVVSRDDPALGYPFVCAYGSQRAIGKEVVLSPNARIGSLFGRHPGLIAGSVWLRDMCIAALQDPNGPRAKAWKALREALACMLSVRGVTIGDDGDVWVTPMAGLPRCLHSLGDSDRAVAGLVIDIMARLWDSTQTVPAHWQMGGIVLIDDVDLYLDSARQRDILRDLRFCFPSLSFVVTARSPVTAASVRACDVVQLGASR